MTAVLPQGWRRVRLQDVADTSLGKMLDAARPKGAHATPYLRNTNVQWSGVDTADVLTVPLSVDERERFMLETGDLLVCEGGEIGRAALWRGASGVMAYQKALHRVRSNGEVELRWLRYLLEHYTSSGLLAGMATGTTIKHLPQRRLRELPVPLPPLEEQRRLVDLLEDHLSRLDAASVNLDLAQRKAKSWAAAAVDLIFQGVEQRAAVDTLLREPMRNGHSASASASGDVRTLTLTSVTKREFTDKNTKMTSADRGRVRDLWLRSGDLLVQRSNTAELVGTCALYTGPDDWAIFPDLLIRLRPDESKILPSFLAAGLASDRVHRELRGKAKGLAGSMPKIDQGALGAQLVPCPDLETQRRLLVTHDRLQEGLARLLVDIELLRRNQVGLRRSLLAAAFSGRLTSIGLESEPTGIRT